jgi:hypothetical protein
VQVKSEAHDKELYQKFKQDIDNEVADMRDLLRQHIKLVGEGLSQGTLPSTPDL